jgi:uncharacterized membrane protein
MAENTAIPGEVYDGAPDIPVATIGLEDVRAALRQGFGDFMAQPSHLVFIGIIYPIFGLILSRFTIEASLLPLLFPLVAGFALIGPFAAIGLYEISRRREQGLESGWSHAFDVLRSPSIGPILGLGGILMLILVLWLAVAHLIYAATFGGEVQVSMMSFLREILLSPAGWALIIIGNIVGFLFAVAAFSLSVISFPLLLDRRVGLATAVETSIKAVRTSPGAMAAWGLIVAGSLFLGSLPFLVGLAVIMPVLGHATWHLYRRIVTLPPNLPA